MERRLLPVRRWTLDGALQWLLTAVQADADAAGADRLFRNYAAVIRAGHGELDRLVTAVDPTVVELISTPLG